MNNDLSRAMPHAVQAEQAVIGGLLLDNDAIDRVGGLRAEHFFLGEHRTIFAAIVKSIEDGKPVDVLTLGDALPTIGTPFLHSLASNTPSSANVGRYAEIVRDRAIRRGLIAHASQIMDAAFEESGKTGRVLVDEAQGALDKLGDSSVKSEPVRVSDDLSAYAAELERRLEGKSSAISTGFPDLDDRLGGGITRGQSVIIAGRPKVGKTALALAIARNAAVDHSVLVLSMEMPRTQLHDRNTSALGRINLDRLLKPSKMTDEDWNRSTVAFGKLQALDLHIDDQAGLRMLDIRAKARMVKRKHGLDLIVIDYLQLGESDGDNRNAQIEALSRGIKTLAKELNVGAIVLSQLSRRCEERADKRPMPSDLRDSGAIEQDCDACILLYRDEVYYPESEDRGIIEANIALNRQGATGVVGLSYIGEQTRVESLEPGTVFGRRAKPQRFGRGLRD